MASLEKDLKAALRSEPAREAGQTRNDIGGDNRQAKFEESVSKLKGVWRRIQGGYVIEVREIRRPENGGIRAGYFSQDLQRFVRVLNAVATPAADGRLSFTVELWDEGYFGSIYRLTYDPKTDLMSGTYRTMDGEIIQVDFERAMR